MKRRLKCAEPQQINKGMRFYYDLHVHSCLSPCADDDNTPNNLAGMAKLCGLNVVALTDHNTTKNCPAFFEACGRYGIVPIPGMELTTSEDIHVICLFPSLESAMSFGEEVEKRRVPIKNRADIFGRQLVLDGGDNVFCEEENLLSNATTISLDEAPAIVEAHGGVCYPAHIDREANGIISVLGTMPETPAFSTIEFNQSEKAAEYIEKYALQGKRTVISSDAHSLTQLREENDFFELDVDENDAEAVREAIIELLK